VRPSRLFLAPTWKKRLILRSQGLRKRNNLSPVLLMMLVMYATELPKMLRIGKEWRCDFGVCVVGSCDILLVPIFY
jgi:hypothetical protein